MTTFSTRILTVAEFQSALNVAEYCAVKKGAELITNLEKGCCSEDEKKVKLMLNLIDAVRCIIPEGVVLSGSQAFAICIIDQSGGSIEANLQIGDFIYPTLSFSPGDTELIVAEAIVEWINSFYPQNFQYRAEYFFDAPDHCVKIIASDYELSNGETGLLVVSTASGLITETLDFDGGVAAVYQGANAISNNDLQIILTKLCKLCKN